MKKFSAKNLSFTFVTFNADKDWKKVFFLFVGLVVVVIVWSGYVFWTVKTEKAFQGTGEEAPVVSAPLPNTSDVGAVRATEETKAVRFEKAKNNSSGIVDPSL